LGNGFGDFNSFNFSSPDRSIHFREDKEGIVLFSLDPDLNTILISIVAGVVVYEYQIIRKYEEKLNKLEERTRWMEFIIKEKELKKH
jgi:hypothetical protein